MKRLITLTLVIAAMTMFGYKAQAQQYALYYASGDEMTAIADGDTLDYHPADWEFEVGTERTYCNIIIENLTDAALLTTQSVTIEEGPEGQMLEVCGNGKCPWDGKDYDVEPGKNPTKPVTVEVGLNAEYRGTTIVKVMVSNAQTLENSVTIYLRIYLENPNQGIDNVEGQAIKVYPNPTRGQVTVGDREYDLGGKPAGVYMLPCTEGTARVIKL